MNYGVNVVLGGGGTTDCGFGDSNGEVMAMIAVIMTAVVSMLMLLSLPRFWLIDDLVVLPCNCCSYY